LTWHFVALKIRALDRNNYLSVMTMGMKQSMKTRRYALERRLALNASTPAQIMNCDYREGEEKTRPGGA
jgi:hypothetical protein